MIWLWLIFIIFHIAISLAVLIFIESGVIRVHKYMFFVVLLMPVWGLILVLSIHLELYLKLDGKKEIGVDKLKLESEIYKGISVDDKSMADSIVPMEEALIVNNPRERRSLIMDVLNDDPREYIEFLQKAGSNDDTEVVHYAVTAMAEISKENDYRLQRLEREYSKNPDDYLVWTDYASFLQESLDKNLMQGQVEVVNRNLLGELLLNKLSKEDKKEDYIALIKNYFKQGNYTEAREIIKKADMLYPNDEEIFLVSLEYWATLSMGEELKRLIAKASDSEMYMSSAVKEAVSFWSS